MGTLQGLDKFKLDGVLSYTHIDPTKLVNIPTSATGECIVGVLDNGSIVVSQGAGFFEFYNEAGTRINYFTGKNGSLYYAYKNYLISGGFNTNYMWVYDSNGTLIKTIDLLGNLPRYVWETKNRIVIAVATSSDSSSVCKLLFFTKDLVYVNLIDSSPGTFPFNTPIIVDDKIILGVSIYGSDVYLTNSNRYYYHHIIKDDGTIISSATKYFNNVLF